MNGMGIDQIEQRIRACDYLSVAQLYLQSNFLLERPLRHSDIKPRLLGHWGTCHGINVAYANLAAFFSQFAAEDDLAQISSAISNNKPAPVTHSFGNFSFILGPGHGFPALQANLFLDGQLYPASAADAAQFAPAPTFDAAQFIPDSIADAERSAPSGRLPLTAAGLAYLCKNFSWPDGFPSHASPFTPGVICEGGELGYALANAYGAALGHPEKTIAVLIGDGELETATALASLNLKSLLNSPKNGRVLPILHLNGYKISAPTIYARKSERELNQLLRGFGFTPILIDGDSPEGFQAALDSAFDLDGELENPAQPPFFILKTAKGATGPNRYHESHQIPLKNPRTDAAELELLEEWLRSYAIDEIPIFDTMRTTENSSTQTQEWNENPSTQPQEWSENSSTQTMKGAEK